MKKKNISTIMKLLILFLQLDISLQWSGNLLAIWAVVIQKTMWSVAILLKVTSSVVLMRMLCQEWNDFPKAVVFIDVILTVEKTLIDNNPFTVFL